MHQDQAAATPEVPQDGGAAGTDLRRASLIRRLEAGIGLSATLVSAPPGFGKTTLVNQWAATTEHPVARLRASTADSDLSAFVHGVVDAVEDVVPGAAAGTRRLLQKSGEPDAAVLGGAFVDDIESCGERVVLLLDDYGTVPGTAAHDFLDAVLSATSQALHVVIVTTHDPPIALRQLVVAGHAHVIRQADLALTTEETSRFLDRQLDVPLTPEELDVVMRGLGGWPAGLRLLALSLADPAARDELVERLPRGPREARTYVCEDLFARKSEEARRYLLSCALLEKFDSELCAAVLEPDRSDTTARAFLEQEAALLVPIDGPPGWFRLNDLLREFLENRARRDLDPQATREIHDRAASRLSDTGHVARAVAHALRGSTPTTAAEIVGRHRIDFLNEGRYPELFQAAAQLPRDVLDSHLQTCLLQVWSTPYDLFEQAVERVSALVATGAYPQAEGDAARGELHLMRLGTLASRERDVSDVSALIEHGE